MAEPAQAPLFDFEKAGGGNRRTLSDGLGAAATLLDRLHASPAARARLIAQAPGAEPPTEAAALLARFGVDVVLNISWYDARIKGLKRRWVLVQVGLWTALIGAFVLLIGLTMKGEGLSQKPGDWVGLLSAFGTFAFGLLQTVQTSTNQKARLAAYRSAGSALKTELYTLEDAWVDRLAPRRGEAEAAFNTRFEAELLPAFERALDASVRAARKILRDEQGQSFLAEAAPDALATALPARLTEVQGLLNALPAVTDPGRDKRLAAEATLAAATAQLEAAEATVVAAKAGLDHAVAAGASEAQINAQREALSRAEIDRASKLALRDRAQKTLTPSTGSR